MHIGLIVTEWHQNQVTDLLNILSLHDEEITLFTTKKYYDEYILSKENEGIKKCLKEGESLKRYLKKVEKKVNEEIDVLLSFPFSHGVIETAQRLRIVKKCCLVQIIFNTNWWTGSNLNLEMDPRPYIRCLLHKMILKNTDCAIVETSTLVENIRNSVYGDTKYLIPTVNESKNSRRTKKQNGYVDIVVPGHVDERRRDYFTLIDAVDSYVKQSKSKAKVTLLGSTSGKKSGRVINRAEKMTKKGIPITYYESRVPIDKFKEKIRKSDLLISPLRRNKKFSIATETYGETKGTGSLSDAIKFSKPLILPHHYNIPPEVSPFVYQYNSKDDLSKLIKKVSKKSSKKKTNKYVEKEYSLHSQYQRLFNILESVVR